MVNHYWVRGADGKGKPDPKWSDYPICVRYILGEIGMTRKVGKREKLPYVSYSKQDKASATFNLGRLL
jgi:hypothetical protein